MTIGRPKVVPWMMRRQNDMGVGKDRDRDLMRWPGVLESLGRECRCKRERVGEAEGVLEVGEEGLGRWLRG